MGSLLVFLTPHISLLVRTAAVLKGSTASAASTTSARAAVVPLALPVAIWRALVTSHWRSGRCLGSLLHGERQANMGGEVEERWRKRLQLQVPGEVWGYASADFLE